MNKQLFISLLIILSLAMVTAVVILYGRGYRFGFGGEGPKILGTGLLVATSKPDGASVYINGHLTTATDNTINLAPGEYTVKISKDGYFAWEKKIKVQEEVVSKAEVTLFPKAPKLDSLTSIGVERAVLDPSLSKLAYTVASYSARKNGVYVLDLTTRPVLTLQSTSTQIVDDTIDRFSTSELSWSPDGQNILATLPNSMYLLSASSFNQNPRDVTATIDNLQAVWDKEKSEKEASQREGLKPQLRTMLRDNFKVIAWSQDETKILYEASNSAELPIIIKPRLIGTNPTLEVRAIEKGSVYVYDLKEDKNYKIPANPPSNELAIMWYTDSNHLIKVAEKKIDIMDYDGTNAVTVYAGPFIDNYVFPSPNISKIVILTNLGNPNISANLYTIGLK